MADIKNIDIFQTVTSVSFQVEPNTNVININKVTVEAGGLQDLQSVTNVGATTTNPITIESGVSSTLLSGDSIQVIKNSVTKFVVNQEGSVTANQVTLNTAPTETAVVGTTRWNNTAGTSETTLKGGSVILKNGFDSLARVVNKVTPNQTLTKANYQAVRISGATGQRLSVELAQGNTDLNSADTIGLVTETIATNQEGFIVTMGQLEEVNTTGNLQGENWIDGDVLYLSPTIAGRLTNIKPNGATGHIIVIGYVEYAHAIHGKIYVKIMNGWELDELHNVFINNPLNNEGLFYESATQLWKNKPISTVLGYTPVASNTAITAGTKTKITYDAKGLVTAGTDATTADIADSLNKRYVTDAQQTVITNTSGTNTGDNATNTQYSGLATSKVNVSDVINTLVSTETAKPLSANQGRVLDLKIAQGIVNWTAKAFLINDEVSHLGKLWQANAAIVSTDVPGTSSKWLEILTGYGTINDLKLKATLIAGKNKFNKDDTSILQGGYLNASGVFLVFGTTYATHFIPILAGQTLYSNQAVTTAGQYHTLYDANKTFISSVQSVKTITATVDGFVKFTCSGATNINQVEVGTVATTYEIYKLSINKDDITSVNDSAIPTTIARSSDVVTLIPGKNKFNKNDIDILTGKYIDNLGVLRTFGTGFVTHYIPIKSGQTFFCNNANIGAGVGHSLYNSSKVLVSTVTGVKLITASQDGFVRYSIANELGYTINNTQVEQGTAFTAYESYMLGVDSTLIQKDIQRVSKHTEITVKRIGTSGVDANFCGLNAIGDALASITDASSINTYNIVVEGVFLFKLQSDFVYSDPSFAEPTVIIGKDWVNIEGKGKENTVIAVELTAGQTFTGGKIYTDFQPVMWNCNSKLSNMSIIGKNCRYSIHMEAENFANNKTATFENLYVNFKGSQEMGGGAGNAIGTGMRLGQTWNFNNCEIVTIGGSPFGVHTALALLQKGGEINFTDCSFWGNIFFHNYPSGRVVNLNLNNCKFNRTRLNPNFYYTTYSTLADYMDFNLKLTTPPIPYFNTHTKGKGLKIESKSQGVSSSVKFDENSTAFNSIIGNSNVLVESRNYALNKTQFGYQWKNGGVGLNGYAIGGLDIDSANTAKTNGLGVLLGNCATVNKTLTIIVDGTTYNIVFNENFTAQNNAYVIAKITAIIGTVANVTEFCPSSEYYPDFGSMESLLNEDTTAILKGMGIVYTTNGMRRALNSDNRIDGICLYDTVIGEYGKCIKQGVIYTSNSAQRFSIAEDVNASRSVGSELGISATAGVFSLTSTPKLLRTIETNIVQII